MTRINTTRPSLSKRHLYEASKELRGLLKVILEFKAKRLNYFKAICRSEADAHGLLSTNQAGRRSALWQWISYTCTELKLCHPGWIVAAFEKQNGPNFRWDWIEGCGLTRQDIEILTRENAAYEPIYPDPNRYCIENCENLKLLRRWNDDTELKSVWRKKDPNWIGSVCALVCVQIDDEDYGIAIAPTLAPYFYHGLKFTRLSPKEPADFVRYVHSLNSVWKDFAAKLKWFADECGKALKQTSRGFCVAPPTKRPEMRRRLDQKDDPEIGDSERRFEKPNEFFRAQPYFEKLRFRFQQLAIDFNDRRGGELLERSFRLSFLVKDKLEAGYRWFLTETQESMLEQDKDLSPDQKRGFYERVFMPPGKGCSTTGEGMVGFLIARGLGPVMFSSPVTPVDYERKACRNTEAWKRMVDCKECERKLWDLNLFTVEFAIGSSSDFLNPGALRDAFTGWPTDEDSIVAVIQYEDAKQLLTYLPHDMRQARAEGALAISEMQACRDGAKAGELSTRADLAASFSHQYVKQAVVLEVQATQIASGATNASVSKLVPASLRQATESFEFQIQAYKREMEAFAKLAQSLYHFEPDVDAINQKLTPVAALILRGFLFGMLVASEGEFNDVAAELLPPFPILREVIVLLRNPDDYNLREAWETLTRQKLVSFSLHGPSGGVLLRPPKPPVGVKPEEIRTLFEQTFEKIYFEVAYNAVRNWCFTYRENSRAFPTFGMSQNREIRLHLPTLEVSSTAGLVVENTAYFSPRNRFATQSYEEMWVSKNRDFLPPRPREQQGVGGWGLYGNTLIADLFRSKGARGTFCGHRVIGPPVDQETRRPYSYFYASKLFIPVGFFSDQSTEEEYER